MASSIYQGGGGGSAQINDAIVSPSTTWSSTKINQAASGNVTIGSSPTLGSLTLTGDLVVQGTTTNINSTVVDVVDELIELNSDRHVITAGGVSVLRNPAGSAAVLYTEATGTWSTLQDGVATSFACGALSCGEITGSGRVLIQNGTAAAPSYTFSADSDTGLYRGVGANSICFSAGGTCVTEVDGNGLTVMSGYPLRTNTILETTNNSGVTVDGVLLRDGGATATSAFLGKTGLPGSPSYAFSGDATSGLYLVAPGALGITAGTIQAMQISSSSTTLFGQLRADAGSAAAPGLSFGTDINSGIYSAAADQLSFSCGGGNVATLTGSLASFAVAMSVTGTASATGQFQAANGSFGAPSYSFSTDPNTGLNVLTGTPDELQVCTGGSARMRVANANVTLTAGVQFRADNAALVTAPDYSFAADADTGMYLVGAGALGFSTGGQNRLSISSTGITPSVRILGTQGTLAAPGYSFAASPNTGIHATGSQMIFGCLGIRTVQLGGNVAQIDGVLKPFTDNTRTCGEAAQRWTTIFATNGTINTSDARMKNTVTDLPADLGLSFVESLRPVTYKWNDTMNTDEDTGAISTTVHTRTHLGLIAQEVESAIAATGRTLSDVDLVDNDALAPGAPPDATDRYGMRTAQLIPILVKAIQELSARVAVLEASA